MKMRWWFVAVGLCVALGSARAAEPVPFDAARFTALQAANQRVLLHVYADWCTTCKHQSLVLEALVKRDEFRDLAILKVDFERQKDVVRQLRVDDRSALIVFRGRKEAGRSMFDTEPASIAALLRKAGS